MTGDKTILIIDDEVICNLALENELKQNGFKSTFSATNYEEGVVIFEREKPDFVLVDINMGAEKNGFDFIDFVNRRSPVIIISGYDKEFYYNQLKDIEIVDYLEKPLNFDRLIELLSA